MRWNVKARLHMYIIGPQISRNKVSIHGLISIIDLVYKHTLLQASTSPLKKAFTLSPQMTWRL
jgi:hypothetical protein